VGSRRAAEPLVERITGAAHRADLIGRAAAIERRPACLDEERRFSPAGNTLPGVLHRPHAAAPGLPLVPDSLPCPGAEARERTPLGAAYAAGGHLHRALVDLPCRLLDLQVRFRPFWFRLAVWRP
jgi:hypothetical protein